MAFKYIMCGCGNPMPQERLELGFKYCVSCAEKINKPKTRGRMVYEHKTGGFIEIMSNESFNNNWRSNSKNSLSKGKDWIWLELNNLVKNYPNLTIVFISHVNLKDTITTIEHQIN